MEYDVKQISELKLNPFTKIGKEWALLTAGDTNKLNTMTVSWGGLGVLWAKNVVTVYVRPQRYTLEYLQQNDLFTLSFYPKEYKKALAYLGKVSGRDEDKVSVSELTPFFVNETVTFEEAELTIVCRKLSESVMDPATFIDKSIDANNYPNKDYHHVFVGEVEAVLSKKK